MPTTEQDPSAFLAMERARLVKETAAAAESGVSRELPRYKFHKEVWALKIAGVKDPRDPESDSDGSRILIPEDAGYAPFRVDHEYVRKHNPKAGGYYVVYADGYKSFSPAEAFEGGYSKI